MTNYRIAIITDIYLPECSARISSKTWNAVKAKKGGTAFFPEGNTIVVGTNPFEPGYIIFVVDEDLPDDSFLVSSDVKRNFYASTEFIDL